MKEKVCQGFINLFERGLHQKSFRQFSVIALLSVSVHYLIYYTGGTRTSLPQLNIPIILLASYCWGLKGSLITAFLLGLATGPFMPLNVSRHIMQQPLNYLIRLVFYFVVAGFSNVLFTRMGRINQKLVEKETISQFTGLYNTKKLIDSLQDLIDDDQDFQVVYLKIAPLEEISKYINYDLVATFLQEFVSRLRSQFPEAKKYSSSFNEFFIVFNHYDKIKIEKDFSAFFQIYENGVQINEYNIELIIKAGLVCNCQKHENPISVVNRARIAADQGSVYQTGIHLYSQSYEEQKKYEMEIASSIKAAIDKQEFYLVYQPIIDVQKRTIAGAEVLMRWDRGDKEPVFPDVFIAIAEKVGLIKELSKFLFLQNIRQNLEWESAGIDIATSINVTINDLIDGAFFQWCYETVEKYGFDRTRMGIELTERTIMKDQERSKIALSDLQERGYAIYIDDFGTGYNSIINMTILPYDVLKIDKIFIDSIQQKEMKSVVRHIIEVVHEAGKLVVAEGVETSIQYEILREIGCDRIQGYYFSKPLQPDDFIEYYTNFKFDVYEMREKESLECNIKQSVTHA